MPSVDVFVIFAVLFILLLLGVLFLIPTGKKPRPTKSKQPAPEENKDWQAVSLRLEKHILALRQETDNLQKKEKLLERDLAVAHDKYAKMQEKISQERSWQKKEHDDVEKKYKEIIRLQEDLKKTEENLEREHSQRLLFERELREAKDSVTSANDLKNSLEIKIAKLQAQCDNYRKEISDLREENAKLSKKQDDVTFVAKSEYVRVEKLLKDTQREFADYKSKINKEIL